MSTLKFNQWLNPDNTENYKCRAWVNFNGIGTVAIRASGNVSSITDAGVGLYQINFSVAMQDINYAGVANSINNVSNADVSGQVRAQLVGSCEFRWLEGGVAADTNLASVVIFR